jgi:hypothetical protein
MSLRALRQAQDKLREAIFAFWDRDCFVVCASCSETKSSLPANHSKQFVIPGEQGETRNPGKKNWIPTCAGMTECFVSAFRLSARAMVNSQ